MKIPDLLTQNRLPARYTCDGADESPPVQWSGVPRGTAELTLSIVATKLVDGKRFFFDWAVAGLSPTSHGIAAGEVPAGAVVGRNSFGKNSYSICPPKGTAEVYFIRVTALTHSIVARPGFEPNKLLAEAERTAKFIGLGGATYTRR